MERRSASLGAIGAATIASGAAASQAAASQAAARKLACAPMPGSLGPATKPGSPGLPTKPGSPGAFARPGSSPGSSISTMTSGMKQGRRDALKSMSLPDIKKPWAPEVSGPPKEGILSRAWTSEHKRLLHEQSERHWLQSKAKHGYIDFSDAERAELRRYFDALADGEQTVGLDRLENMLISLGVAATQQEVKRIVDSIDANGNGELDFEEYLEIFRTRTDSEIFQVFKSMMEGRLGDRNLNFQTVISTYRRNLFLKATGGCRRCGGWARCPCGANADREVRLGSDSRPVVAEVEHGTKILHNFAALQRNRYSEALKAAEDVGGPELPADRLEFDPKGDIPPGNLAIVWRGVIHDHNLVSSRPNSADRSKRTVPESPKTVISSIVKVSKPKKRNGPHGATVMIQAPAFEDSTRNSSAGARNSWNWMTQA